VDVSLTLKGAFEQTSSVGYNVKFVYPREGLNALASKMADRCEIHYGKRVIHIDVDGKTIQFGDGSEMSYDTLISTIPLNRMMEITDIEVDQEPDPYTSVLVLNIGATRGPECPDDQWLYIPYSQAGFHRVGFYSNVDVSFLPRSSQSLNDRVGIYVERAYRAGDRLSAREIQAYSSLVEDELREWGFIDRAEVIDPTWIDVAYTWAWPGSKWRTQALQRLDEYDILPVGRYARWTFQGIADSIRDGLYVGGSVSASL
jgi:protoporphyrinogen oxidase